MMMKLIAAVGLMTAALFCAPPARADWNCQPAYMGVETICNDGNHQVICFNWGQMAGKCVDQTAIEVPHPPGA